MSVQNIQNPVIERTTVYKNDDFLKESDAQSPIILDKCTPIMFEEVFQVEDAYLEDTNPMWQDILETTYDIVAVLFKTILWAAYYVVVFTGKFVIFIMSRAIQAIQTIEVRQKYKEESTTDIYPRQNKTIVINQNVHYHEK